MEIEKCQKKIKCDFNGCKNMAEFSISTKKVFSSKMHFCKECLNGLYLEIGKKLVPKAPKTPFKKGEKHE